MWSYPGGEPVTVVSGRGQTLMGQHRLRQTRRPLAKRLASVSLTAAYITLAGAALAAVALAEPLDDVLRILNATPAAKDQTDLAAHLETSGHWSFASRAGERFTASGGAELVRAIDTLAPRAKIEGHRLVVHLSQATLHAPTVDLVALPKATALRALVGGESVPVTLPVKLPASVPASERASARPLLMVTQSIALIADTDRAFLSAYAHLTRRVPAFSMRVLGLEPGAPRVLSSSPRVDLSSKQTLVDLVDPSAVAEALSGAPRQTVLIKGRLDGDALLTRGTTGGDMRSMLKDIEAAAAANDITLFVLESTAPQPGGRNWLWQPVFDKVPPTGASLRIVDLIATVSDGTPLVIAAEVRAGRVHLTAQPAKTDSGRSQAEVWLRRVGDAAKDLFGAAPPRSLIVSLPSVDRQDELSRRLIGWLPSVVPLGYGGLLAFGLLGWSTSRRWFARLWPPETAGEYANGLGHAAARAIRACVFVIVFIPAVAIVAVPAHLLGLVKRAPKAGP